MSGYIDTGERGVDDLHPLRGVAALSRPESERTLTVPLWRCRLVPHGCWANGAPSDGHRATDEESNPHPIKVRGVQATLVGMDGPSRGRGMKESAIWSAIVESPLAGAYVTEAYSLAVDVVERADSVMANASPPPSGSSYIKVDHNSWRNSSC